MSSPQHPLKVLKVRLCLNPYITGNRVTPELIEIACIDWPVWRLTTFWITQDRIQWLAVKFAHEMYYSKNLTAPFV